MPSACQFSELLCGMHAASNHTGKASLEMLAVCGLIGWTAVHWPVFPEATVAHLSINRQAMELPALW